MHREVAPRLPGTWRRGPLLDPRYQAEGDIHYLVFRRDYPAEIYDRYRDSATDMRVLVAREAA